MGWREPGRGRETTKAELLRSLVQNAYRGVHKSARLPHLFRLFYPQILRKTHKE